MYKIKVINRVLKTMACRKKVRGKGYFSVEYMTEIVWKTM